MKHVMSNTFCVPPLLCNQVVGRTCHCVYATAASWKSCCCRQAVLGGGSGLRGPWPDLDIGTVAEPADSWPSGLRGHALMPLHCAGPCWTSSTSAASALSRPPLPLVPWPWAGPAAPVSGWAGRAVFALFWPCAGPWWLPRGARA